MQKISCLYLLKYTKSYNEIHYIFSLLYLGFSYCLSPPFLSEEILKLLIRSLLIFSRLIYLKTLLAIVVNLCIYFFALLSYEGQEIPNTAFCYLAPHCYYRSQSNSCNNCKYSYMISAINIIYTVMQSDRNSLKTDTFHGPTTFEPLVYTSS